MHRVVINGFGQLLTACRRPVRGYAFPLALSIAPFAMLGQARAACTPPSTASNATVDCSGVIINSGPDNITGYGTNSDDSNTYNIQVGATLRGTSFGLRVGAAATINNFGDISGPLAAGITTSTRRGTVTLTNATTGTISGNNSLTLDRLNLSNAGQILGIGSNGGAIIASTASVINANTGIISGVLFGIDAETLDLDNAGTISATGATGNGISSTSAAVTNTSTGIIAGGLNGIQATTTATVNNAGNISGNTGSGIIADTAVVTNTSSGTISGGLNGIQAASKATVNNAGTISGGAASLGIRADITDVSNSGSISGGVRGDTTVTVRNAATGAISGAFAGVSAGITSGLATVHMPVRSLEVLASSPRPSISPMPGPEPSPVI